VKPLDWLLLLALGAIWGGSYPFLRVAVPEFTPIPLIAVRIAVATLCAATVLGARGGFGVVRARFWVLTCLGAINSAIPFCLFAFATLTLTAGFAAVLNATVPLFGAVLGFACFRERFAPTRALGLSIGFSGVVVLVWHKISFGADALSIAAGFTAALLYALAAHLTKRRLSGVDPLAITTGSLIGSCLLLAIPAALTWPEQMPGPRAWLAALVLGVVSTAIAYLLYFHLIRSVGATRSMIVTYLIPAFALFWGWLFLGEPIGLDVVAGAAVILLGTALVARTTSPSVSTREAEPSTVALRTAAPGTVGCERVASRGR
jgi:drug/metabolite transporter (DMT)-like permease